MIELQDNRLVFSFPEVHPEATLSIEFQRTLRIPDDGRAYSLPPGLGRFPIQHVDDHAANVPETWLRRGGVMLPMFQSEALWMALDAAFVADRRTPYPFAIKVAAGKRCAVTGDEWRDGLTRNPQNYMVAPAQPWLDGFVVEKGSIRQFVAMPLGAGYTAEEQITGKAEHGGVQLAVYPMKREKFEKRFPLKREGRLRRRCYSDFALKMSSPEMGLAPGGLMKQEIYNDPYGMADWDLSSSSRCFVHLCNSMVWRSITGLQPPHPAPTAKQYSEAGLPWFEWYDDGATAVEATPTLKGLKSVAQLSALNNTTVLPENESAIPQQVIVYRQGLKPGQVREGAF